MSKDISGRVMYKVMKKYKDLSSKRQQIHIGTIFLNKQV